LQEQKDQGQEQQDVDQPAGDVKDYEADDPNER